MDFLLLDPKQIADLTPEELGGLAAYLLRREGRRVASGKMYEGWFDIEFDDVAGAKEFLRCYFVPMPINAPYQLLTELQGKSYVRVRLWMTGKFTTAQRTALQDVPFAFEMLDISGLQGRLSDSQRRLPSESSQPSRKTGKFNWPQRATEHHPVREPVANWPQTQSGRGGRKIDWSDILVFICLGVAVIWVLILIFLGLLR